jgi:hypothetical protein
MLNSVPCHGRHPFRMKGQLPVACLGPAAGGPEGDPHLIGSWNPGGFAHAGSLSHPARVATSLVTGEEVPMARIVGMPGPTAGNAVPVGRARALAALHDLALAGRAPALAAAYAAAYGDAAAGGDRHAAADDRLGRGDCHAPAGVDQRDRALRRAVSGPRRGGAPGGRERGRADRRGLFGWAQSQCRSRWHHLQQRTVAGRPVCGRISRSGSRGSMRRWRWRRRPLRCCCKVTPSR